LLERTLLLLPHLGATGYVYVILLAEIFNFSLSLTGLRSALEFRLPLLRGALLPVAAILPAVTVARRLLPPTSLPRMLASILLSLLFAALLLGGLLLLFEKKVSKKKKAAPQPIDKSASFGYNKSV